MAEETDKHPEPATSDEVLPIVREAGIKNEKLAHAISCRLNGLSYRECSQLSGISERHIARTMAEKGIYQAVKQADRTTAIVARATDLVLESIAQTMESLVERSLKPREVAQIGERYMMAIERLVRATADATGGAGEVSKLLAAIHAQGGGSVTMSIDQTQAPNRLGNNQAVTIEAHGSNG